MQPNGNQHATNDNQMQPVTTKTATKKRLSKGKSHGRRTSGANRPTSRRTMRRNLTQKKSNVCFQPVAGSFSDTQRLSHFHILLRVFNHLMQCKHLLPFRCSGQSLTNDVSYPPLDPIVPAFFAEQQATAQPLAQSGKPFCSLPRRQQNASYFRQPSHTFPLHSSNISGPSHSRHRNRTARPFLDSPQSGLSRLPHWQTILLHNPLVSRLSS